MILYLRGVLTRLFRKHFSSPSLDRTIALIAGLFAFRTGVPVRPFGAAVFGGDLIGRKCIFMPRPILQ